MFFIVMFLFCYVPCAFFNILMLLVILIDRPILHSIYLIVNKDLILCILLCSVSYPFDNLRFQSLKIGLTPERKVDYFFCM